MAKRASDRDTRGSSRARHWAEEGKAKIDREEKEKERKGLLDDVLGGEEGELQESRRGWERERIKTG